MNSFASKYAKEIGFAMVTGAIFLFIPFIQTVMFASFLVIMDPNTMKLSTYLLTLWGSFTSNYFFNIPAIILLAIVIYGLKIK